MAAQQPLEVAHQGVQAEGLQIDILEAVEDYLTCAACQEIPRCLLIRLCSNGHLIDGECITKIARCPLCNCTQLLNRSILAETVLKLLWQIKPLPCTNHVGGCTVTGLKDELEHHEVRCLKRLVRCPSFSNQVRCNFVGTIEALTALVSKLVLM